MMKHSSGEKKYRAYRNETHKMEKKYAAFASRFDFEAFVPLFPFVEKRLRGLLEELENLFCFRLKSLTCFDFCLLSAKASKEEQLIVIGDPDEFYDYVVQENVDFQDMVAFLLNTLADYSECLLRMIKHTCSKMYRDILNDEIDMIRRLYLKDIEIRDVFDERSKENPESGIEPMEIATN